LLSDIHLRKTIADLKAIERKCFGSRWRFSFYEYLAEVFAFYSLLRRTNEAKISANRIAKLFGLRKQRRTHPIATIINVTSAADQKTKSRWCRALRLAWNQRKRWEKLVEFLQSNGGPAGCAEKFAALHRRTGPSYVRVGSQDPVPRIPLFANVEPLRPDQMFVKDGRVFTRPDVTERIACISPPTNRP
jgi:hypothetical protein